MTALLLTAVLAQLPFEPPSPRQRRAVRENCVAVLGEVARSLVEAHDEAVAALHNCSSPVAKQLCDFHNQGALAKLPRPAQLLRVIAMQGHGDDVCLFALKHAEELSDLDAFDAFCGAPLEYAMKLRPLADGAARRRANRLTAQEEPQQWWQTPQNLALGAGGLLLVLLLVRARRPQASP